MSSKFRFLSFLVLMVALLLLTSCAQTPTVPEVSEEGMQPKVLLITGTGGLGDQGFNDAGYAETPERA